jgi:hypothetical protein
MTGGDQQRVATSDYRSDYHHGPDAPPTPQQPSINESDRLSITMGLTYNIYLNSTSSRIYGCKNCKTHLSNHDDILSRVSAP